jgi:osmotically-inducible protein OsmY
MKRYQLGACLLWLAIPACSKQGNYADAQRAATQRATQAAKESSEAYTAAKQAERDAERASDKADRALSDTEQRTVEGRGQTDDWGQALPPHEEKRETASTTGTVPVPPGQARAIDYGNPPSAGAAPLQGGAIDQGAQPGAAGRQGNLEQGTSDGDRRLTQRIRTALMNDSALSYSARNVRVITKDGNITLRGLVMTDQERWQVERVARAYAGSGAVDNRIEIKNSDATR